MITILLAKANLQLSEVPAEMTLYPAEVIDTLIFCSSP